MGFGGEWRSGENSLSILLAGGMHTGGGIRPQLPMGSQ